MSAWVMSSTIPYLLCSSKADISAPERLNCLLVLAAMLVVVAHIHFFHELLVLRSVLHKSLILLGR